MDEKDLISGLQTHLAARLSVPIRTSGLQDERPVPAVIISDWDTNDENFHNSAFAGEAVGDFDDDGTDEYERYLNFNWKTRVEFTIRHTDEVDCSSLKGDVKREMRLIRENPQQFDDELLQARLGADGNPTYTFTEQKEAELMVSVRFYGDHTMTLTPSDLHEDTLEEVKKKFTFNP